LPLVKKTTIAYSSDFEMVLLHFVHRRVLISSFDCETTSEDGCYDLK